MPVHPSSRRTLVRGGAILSQDPSVGDLVRGDVLVEGDRVVAVGPDLADEAGPAPAVLDATDRVVLPGFVDSHVHAWEGLLRGMAPTADFGAYLGLTAFGHGPRYTPADMYAGTLATALVALDAGITTVVDNSHNALTPDHSRAALQALTDVGIRGVHAVGSPFGADLDHVRGTALALHEECAGDGLLSVRLFEVNPSAALWAFARDHGLWISTETGPHTPGIDDLLADLARQGLFTERHALNHCYDLQERTWDVIRDSGAVVNLAPRSDAAFGLGTTVLGARAALSRGITVGLSGDNEVSYGLSMFAEMQNLLSRTRSDAFRRHAAGDDDAVKDLLTAGDLLHAATVGGAANAGLAHEVGSITPGKKADLVLVRTDDASTVGVEDPLALVAAFAHAGNVDTVMVGGRLRKHRGQLTGIDVPAARTLVADRRRELLGSAGA
jgi:5-methylthioadenosine/S-adenosylhomocysteine deaminase